MIVTRVCQYLKLNGRAALRDMAAVLRIEPDALRAILQQLQASGRVRRLPAATPCQGGCNKCQPESVELYEWQLHQSPTSQQ